MAKIRVLIVDDHAIVRAGLRMLINPQPDLEVVGEAADGQEALCQARAANPDVLTLDLTMPGGGGLKILERLRQAYPQTRVLVLTMHEDPSYLRAALAAGASGYVAKSAVDGDLLAAIRSVAQGRTFVTMNLSDNGTLQVLGDQPTHTELPPRPPVKLLSSREQEVLKLLAQGYTNQEVGTQLCLSVKTIETYRAHIVEKLGLRSRADLTRYALEVGLLEAGPILSRIATPEDAASFVRVFLTNRLASGITLTSAARFSLMSSLISSNYPDTAQCPHLVRIGQSQNSCERGLLATGNGQLRPANVMEGPVAANNIMEGSIMLVLSRKVGESIFISESIRVTVVQAANGRIRLGIAAPPEVKVLREELTKSCVNPSPSKNGKAEPLPPSAQLP